MLRTRAASFAWHDDVRKMIARTLEVGAPRTSWRRAGARVWQALSARGLRRPLVLPPGVHGIGVGSAVLGGAGKTPVSVALVRALAARGERVALVGHAYRASPRVARVVT